MCRLASLCILAVIVSSSLEATLDSDNHDCGSCGNACCLMEFMFTLPADSVYTVFVTALKAGGIDKKYKFVEGTDIRKDNLTSGAQYRIQATHPSINASFSDSLSFVLASNSSSATIVRGFSVSTIEVSLCDGGQNYRNLANFIKGLSKDYAQRITFGCTNTMGNATS